MEAPARRRPPLRRIALFLFGHLTSLCVRLLGASWRVEILGIDPRLSSAHPPTHTADTTGAHSDARDRSGMTSPDTPADSPPHLAALFHESMLPTAWLYRDRGYSVAVSRSRDGDLIDATLRGLGYAPPARGSSSRGGSAALRGLLRRWSEGTTVAVLVDGPRGPARVSKTGIVALARMAGAPIQPVAFSARPALRLRSWDRSLIPLPFARVVCAYGDPLVVAPECDDDAEQSIARRLDERLTALHHAADARLLSR